MVNSSQWTEAQVGVIGSILIDPSLAPEIVAGTDRSDFSGECLSVYNAIAAMLADNEPIDAITVRNRLGAASGDLLMRIMQATPTAANASAYVAACKEQGRMERVHRIAGELLNASSLAEARALLSKAEQETVEQSRTTVWTAVQAMQHFYDGTMDGPVEYLDWGLERINRNLLIKGGKVVVIGGYPSDGKSAIMLQFAYHIAQKKRVGVFSLETDNITLTQRLISAATDIPYRKIRKNDLAADDWKTITKRGPDFTGRSFELIESSGMTVEDICSMTLAHRFDVIFIDYLQLIDAPGSRYETRNDELSKISRQLKRFAVRNGVTVVELSQLTRPQRGKSGKYPPPTMRSLRESGQIEQDADAIMLLYRTDEENPASNRMLNVAKVKEGTIGHIELRFDGNHQRFSPADEDSIPWQQLQELERAGRNRREREKEEKGE